MKPSLEALKKRIEHLKGETVALYLAARHPGTPWYAKVFVACVAGRGPRWRWPAAVPAAAWSRS